MTPMTLTLKIKSKVYLLENMADSSNIFMPSVLTHVVYLPANRIGNNLDDIILNSLQREVGNRCTTFGYIDRDSIAILQRSIGKVNSVHLNGSVSYDISYRANLCNPDEGSTVECEVKSINKMGILADKHPLTIVLARQHHQEVESFDKVKVGEVVQVKIIGKRFELNDEQITAIGKLIVA